MIEETPELLAPAGSMTALNAAVRAGADAVYLGLQEFNARCGAENFTFETLKEACSYAHARGVKIYVALNTIVITRELPKVSKLVEKAISAGADAFIVQDAGLAFEISKVAGADYLHISTQMNIHNLSGVRVAKAFGAKRITLARELSIEEIKHIAKCAHELDMEVECFAHGAICVCYSGQCLFSSCVGARSANRGKCAQVCRLPYKLVSGENKKVTSDEKAPHLLSPKDMCTIDKLKLFVEAGVDSLKIEGRMKSPEYVFSVVKVYREILDSLKRSGEAEVTKKQMESLKANFSRGFTSGLLYGERGNDFMSYDRPNNRGIFVGRIKNKRIINEKTSEIDVELSGELNPKDTINVWNKHGGSIIKVPDDARVIGKMITIRTQAKCKDIRVKDRVFKVKSADGDFRSDLKLPKIPVDAKIEMIKGKPVVFEVCSGVYKAIVQGDIVEPARTKAVSSQDVKEHFDRLGETNFVLGNFEITLDEGVGIGFSQIHKLRTQALDVLFEKLSKRNEPHQITLKMRNVPSKHERKEPQICAVITNAEDARLVSKNGIRPYVPALNHKMGQATRAGVKLQTSTQTPYPSDVVIMSEIARHEEVGDSREARLSLTALEQMSKAKHVCCNDIASAMQAHAEGKTFDIGQFFPVANDSTVELINNLKPRVVWLSPELNLNQIEDVAPKIESDVGIYIIGKQRLMTCEHCVLMSEGPCAENCATCRRRNVSHCLVDRKNYEFPVVSDCLGRSTVYNSCTLDLTCNLDDLQKCGVNHFMIDATLMEQSDLRASISRVKEAFRNTPKSKLKNSTSGHLFRGV